MENASKALLMAVSMLIGLIVLSLGIYLVNTFKSFSQDYNDSLEIQRMEQFNAQFTAFSTRNNVSIHEIMTLANYAKEFNTINNIEKTNNQYIKVKIKLKNGEFNLSNEENYPKRGENGFDSYDLFINALLDGTYIYKLYGNSLVQFDDGTENKGQYQYDYIYDGDTKKKIYYNCYKCSENSYEVNPQTGRVESITFEFQKSYTE